MTFLIPIVSQAALLMSHNGDDPIYLVMQATSNPYPIRNKKKVVSKRQSVGLCNISIKTQRKAEYGTLFIHPR